MSLTPQEEYVEAGYFADADYVGGIADVVVGISPYVVEDYIEAGYFIPGGSFASLTATLELAIQFAEAIINSTTGMNIDVVRIKQFVCTMNSEFTAGHEENGGIGSNVDPSVVFDTGADVATTATMSTTAGKISQLNANISGAFAATMNVIATMTGETLMQSSTSMSTSAELIVDSSGLLEYFANLNAQAAATRTVTTVQSSNFGISSAAGVSYQGASDLVSASSLTALVDSVIFSDSTTINSVSALTANAIQYQLRPNPYNRPHNLTEFVYTDWEYSTSVKKYGTASVKLNQALLWTGPKEVDNTYSIDRLPNISEDFVFELWQRIDTADIDSSYNGNYFEIINVESMFNVWIKGSTSGIDDIRLTYQDDAGSLVDWFSGKGTVVSLTGVLDADAWNHIVFRRSSNTLTVEINGVAEYTRSSFSDAFDTDINSDEHYLQLRQSNSFIDAMYIDAVTMRYSDATISGSSSEPVSTNNTVFLYNFNNTILDETYFTFEGNAIANTVSSSVIDVTKLVDADADIAANISLSSSGGIIKTTSSTMNAATGLSSAGLRIKTTDANLASEFGCNITENYIRGATATPSVIAGVSISVGIIFQGDMVADSIASSLTAAGRVGDYFANADATTTLTTSGVVTRGANSTINVSTTTSATPNYTRGATSTVAAVISLTSSLVTIKDNSMVAVASSALTASVGEITQGEVNVNSVAGLSCDASRLSVEVANFGGVFDINSVANTVSSGAAQISANTDTTALAGVNYEASATMQGFTAIISINKILHVDQYIYIVPKETRVWSIPKETRSHVIDRELRSYSIKGT